MNRDELIFDTNEYPYFTDYVYYSDDLASIVTIKGLYTNFYNYFISCYDSYLPLTIGKENYEMYSYIGYLIEQYFGSVDMPFIIPSQIAIKMTNWSDTNNIDKYRDMFAYAVLRSIRTHVEEWNNKYNILTFFGNLTKDELLAINNISDTNTTSTTQGGSSSENIKTGSGTLQKYANTPTAVNPESSGDTINVDLNSGSFNESGFQSKYQNSSSATEQLNVGETTRSNTANREGSATYTRKHTGNIDLLNKIYEKLPQGFAKDVLECVSPLFINVE